MITVRELHDKAMSLAQQAMVARHKGEPDHANALAHEAYLLEVQAVALVPEEKTSEPTLSILYRSAASLALQCGEYQESLRLIAKGLSGYPPADIENELRVLYEKLVFEKYLIDRNIILEDAELELSMRGKGVGAGAVLYSEFINRIQKTKSLLDRTVQRLMSGRYQRSGRIAETYRPFTPILTAPKEGSFVISIKLGTPEKQQMPLFPNASDVIDEIVRGIDFVNRSDESGLRNMIGQEGYYRQFVSLTRDMAPDGDRIKFVGFSSKSKSVSLTRQRSEIELAPEIEEKEKETNLMPITVQGQLDFATSRKQDVIGLTTEDGTEYTIIVEEGMDDLVRSYYGRWVSVSGMFNTTTQKITPKDIQSTEDQ